MKRPKLKKVESISGSVEIDQSGKIADTQVDTVLAYSNSHSRAVLISAKTKRECLIKLRKLGRTGKGIYIQLFTTGLYLLLKSDSKILSKVTIDIEYPGYNATIKEHLHNLLRKSGVVLDREVIHFALIGKKSPAHIKAKLVYDKKSKPDLTVKSEAILKLFSAKNKKIGDSSRRKA